MRVDRIKFRQSIATLIFVATLVGRAQGQEPPADSNSPLEPTPDALAADSCQCHTLYMFKNDNNECFFLSMLVISGGNDPCPAEMLTFGYAKANCCHKNYIPYPMCPPPGNVGNPCDHCPSAGDDCSEQESDSKAAPSDSDLKTLAAPRRLPARKEDPTEGNLTESRLQQVGPVRVRYLKIVSDGAPPRWVKLSALTVERRGADAVAPFTVHIGFEIQGPAKPCTEVNIEAVPVQDGGPGEDDDWVARHWTTTVNGEKVTYAIRMAK